MCVLAGLEPKAVFKYFEQLSAIHRGSGDMTAVADYCVDFAERHSLKVVRDNANNVIIYKAASKGYEKSEPIILQGHLDMVCQRTADCNIDFLSDGLRLYIDGDFIKAEGTTLGADNGIAVAMVLAILASDDIAHPAIEAVFTTDEEIGMVGALQLDGSLISAKRMINLDSEDQDVMTVSCAGGSDLKAVLPTDRKAFIGEKISLTLGGLKGGHSGVCIHEGRVNADILAGRVLDFLSKNAEFEIISINGGDKSNAIASACTVELATDNAEKTKAVLSENLQEIKNEIAHREGDFTFEITTGEKAEYSVIANKSDLIYLLLLAPNGVQEMSVEIEGLVETSLNLGILKTEQDSVLFGHALRSNKKSALKFLEQKLIAFYSDKACKIKTGGHYPPWEYNANSTLQRVYIETYKNQFGESPRVEAIHAGLECGVFADMIEGFDAIAIGPQMYDVHTVSERLSISSTEQIYKLLLKILENLK